MVILGAVLGVLCGFAVGWLLGQARQAGEVADLRVKVAEQAKGLETEQGRAKWLEDAEAKLKDAFARLAGDSLRENARTLTGQAKAEIIEPLRERLEDLGRQVRDLEGKREGAYSGMTTQVGRLISATDALSRNAIELQKSLQSSGTQGEWGQLQLRRLVELSGMQEHVLFDEQVSAGDLRPDMVIKLTGGGQMAVDAKTTLRDYQQAQAASDEATRARGLEANAKALRDHVKDLVKREYWKKLEGSPECVVMFVPAEGAVVAAYTQRPELFEEAMQDKVLITTPVSLLALLKAVAFGWQQQQIVDNLSKIQEACEEFYDRLGVLFAHVQTTGTRLDALVKAHNDGVASLERRVLPAGEKIRRLGIGAADLAAPKSVETTIRRLNVPEATDPPAAGA